MRLSKFLMTLMVTSSGFCLSLPVKADQRNSNFSNVNVPTMEIAQIGENFNDETTPTNKPTNTPVNTPANTPTNTPVNTPANTPTNTIQQTTPTPINPQTLPTERDPRVLVGEVVIVGVENNSKLQDVVYDAIRTRPGRTATKSQLQEDVNAIYATGYFSDVNIKPEDTPLGVRVNFVVKPNPILKQVKIDTTEVGSGKQAINQTEIDNIFKDKYGEIINFNNLKEQLAKVNKWYKDNGYDLAQVVDVSQPTEDGIMTLVITEGIIEDVQVRFLNKDKETQDDQGKPIRGRTRQFIITRELQMKAGDVFNRQQAQIDLRRVFGLGLFEDVQLSFNPGQDPRKVVISVDVIERNSGSVSAGAGVSSANGLFGSISYQEQNIGGNNQKLGTELQIGEREFLFDINFTDPWIAGDPYRTSYTVNGFRRRTISLVFDGGPNKVNLPNGDRPRVLRLGGGVTFSRPLAKNALERADWVGSLGLQYQRVSIRNADGDVSSRDEKGNLLSFSNTGLDDLLTLQLGLVSDKRNDALRPTSGSVLRFGVEQSVPIGEGSIFLNRLRGSYSYYMPVNYLNFSKGAQTLAFNIQGGTVLGDLPPYEAFILGGNNSVRGFEDGGIGSGRSFLQATAEYRFPMFSILGGALFVDAGTDLGTGKDVPGNPAAVRGKPGNGLGYGLGVRVQSPLGPLRLDYGFNDQGESKLHFGIGEKF